MSCGVLSYGSKYLQVQEGQAKRAIQICKLLKHPNGSRLLRPARDKRLLINHRNYLAENRSPLNGRSLLETRNSLSVFVKGRESPDKSREKTTTWFRSSIMSDSYNIVRFLDLGLQYCRYSLSACIH